MSSPFESLYRRFLTAAQRRCLEDGAIRTPLGRMGGEIPVASGLHQPFPPALVPVYSDGEKYIGLWLHPIVNGRTPTWVKLYGERWLIDEVARSFEQFLFHLFHDVLGVGSWERPGEPWEEAFLSCTPALRRLRLGTLIADLWASKSARAYDVTYREAELFRNSLPRHVVNKTDTYSGEFPVPSNITKTHLARCCGFEMGPKVVKAAKGARIDLPPWMASSKASDVFRDCLEQRDFAGAWLTLNSRGWDSVSQVREALHVLATASGNADVKAIAATWEGLAFPHDHFAPKRM